MEEIKRIASSGLMSISDIIGLYSPEKTTEWSSWITTPLNWQTRQTLKVLADNLNVNIIFDLDQIDGWIFKSRTTYFKVAGLQSKVDRFIRYFNLFIKANAN